MKNEEITVTKWNAKYTGVFAVTGVCLYIASLAIPFKCLWDIPLFALSLISFYVAVSGFRNRSVVTLPIIFPVFVFLCATVLSILVSKDIARSACLSVSLLPAVLLFFLVAGYFCSTKDTRLLYFTFSSIALGLASVLLWAFWRDSGAEPVVWMSYAKSPVLVVPNDVTFLAVIAPFSLALLYLKPKCVVVIITALSVLLSISVVCIYQSRGALVTMIVSISCFALLIRPKIGLVCGLAIVALTLLIDGFMGFPLAVKFVRNWDGSGRIPLWLSALAMFLDAPLLGHGPHTFVDFYKSYQHIFTLPSWVSVESRVVPWAHNLYLEVLAEQGIVGLTSLGFLLSCGISAAWNLKRATSIELKILGYAAFSCIVSFCFASVLELTFLRLWVVIIMFTILGVIAQLSSFQKETKGEKN